MATDNNNNKNNQDKTNNTSKKGVTRRDVLKGIATIPVVGGALYGALKRHQYDNLVKSKLAEELQMSYEAPDIGERNTSDGPTIRLGIIGFGIRGNHLLRATGYMHPEDVEDWKKAAAVDSYDKRYHDFLMQDDLNVVINGVCDIFDVYADRAQRAAANINRESVEGKMGPAPRRYKNYKDLLAADDIDAVIIATPDHWHGTMAIDAARHGKHVYLEKPMTWTVEETYEVRKAVKDSGIIFQLGHQGRQTESYIKAKEAIDKNLLGKISLIEVATNRNSPNGAWVYPIHPEASPQTIDWKQFIGPAPSHPFNLERFFRWRCWWDYSTGLNGDLLTHEYDAINQILGVGIPHSAVSSGGIYYYKDGRTVPDVLQVAYEFPKHDFTMLYSATLSSQKDRGKVIMGHDAWMELGNSLSVMPDPSSTRYQEKIENGIIEPGRPIYSYIPGSTNVDAVTSATEQYFAGRGLLYTYRGGKRVDTTHLHIKEWLDSIRLNQQPSCDINAGFEEAITAHMATKAYHEKRQVFWNDVDNVIE